MSVELSRTVGRTHQHDGAHVVLGVELGDEDVRGDEVVRIAVLHVPDYVHHPLEVLLRARDPQEVHLPQRSRSFVKIILTIRVSKYQTSRLR